MGAWGVGTDPWGVGTALWGDDGSGPTPPPGPVVSRRPVIRPPGRLLCRVIAPSGRWAYLNAHGQTSGLSYTYRVPSGGLSAAVALDLPVAAAVPGLVNGARFEVLRGADVVMRGRVAQTGTGTPRQIEVDGLGGLATQVTLKQSGPLLDIVQLAIANDGLPWVVEDEDDFDGARFDTSDDPITTKLDEAMTTGFAPLGKRWVVEHQGQSELGLLRIIDEPDGDPTLIIRATDLGDAIGLNNFATRVTVHFNNSDHGGDPDWIIVVNDDAEAIHGPVPSAITLARGASYSEAYATAAGDRYLARRSPRLTLVGSITVSAGQITTAQGGPVDLPNVANIAGRVARLQFATPLLDALVGPTLSVDVPLGEISYDDDAGTVSVAPIDGALTPAQIMFGAMGGGDYIDPSNN